MSKEKFVVWSNLDLDLDDWRADLEDEYPGLNDDELIEKMTEINDSYRQRRMPNDSIMTRFFPSLSEKNYTRKKSI